MKVRHLGIFGVMSLLSYTSMVIFSSLAYPGYDWLRMAVSELSAVGAPSASLAASLNALFGPCAVVSIMGVCVSLTGVRSCLLKRGIILFAVMEWLTVVGYQMFPFVQGAPLTTFQNIMHLMVTVDVVLLSIISMVLMILGTRKHSFKRLHKATIICFLMMMGGAIGTGVMPKAVFGLFERFSTFSVVIMNAVLGIELLKGTFSKAAKGSEQE